MRQRFICKVKHPRDFGIALQIMAELKRGCGTISTIHTQNLDHQQALLDKNSLKLWLYTLLGSGYIKKVNSVPNGNCYSLTSKGEDELRYHTKHWETQNVHSKHDVLNRYGHWTIDHMIYIPMDRNLVDRNSHTAVTRSPGIQFLDF